MTSDPIIDEVRTLRAEYAQQFDFDLKKMVNDLQKKQNNHMDKLVSFAPKPVMRKKTA